MQQYVPEFEKRWNHYARPVGDSWRVDETYIKVKGQWVYLYRAVDKQDADDLGDHFDLNVMYHLTRRMMISWSKCRPLNRSCAEVGSVIPAVIAGYRAFQQFAPEPFLALASYRNTLRHHVSPLTFVYLDVDAETIRNRLKHRTAHFSQKN